MNGAANGGESSAAHGAANPPTPAHHPSRKPLGALSATLQPLPLFTPDSGLQGAAQRSAIPTHHNTPRAAPPRQRARLFELDEAPTFYPTVEQFADPLKYIQWVGEPSGGNGKEYGIVKIVPPEGWSPPFVLDQERFRFRTRVQRLNSLSADARASLNYQEQLQKFHAQQGHARVSIPIVDRRPVDLYQLKLVVASYGGYDAVARNRKWAEVTRRLGYDEKDSCHLAAQIKAAYSRIIYPFERFLEANRDSARRATDDDDRGQSAEAPMTLTQGSVHEEMSADQSGTEDVSMTDGDTSMNTRRRSSRRKTDAKDTPVILSQRRRKQQPPSPPPEGTAGDYYLVPGAEEQMCEICLRGDDGVSMLLCDECNRGYHMFCLDPPLTSIPRSEWYCPPCLVGTGNDYGFDDGETHSLSSFWKRAEAFRAAWWKQRSGNGDTIWTPPNGEPNGLARPVAGSDLAISEDDVEREFWRLVHNPDETVEVEYGADVHSTTHGSALPTLETHPLSPYSRDGWNLNNLPILGGSLLRYIKSDISGMTVPWIYVGMMFSTFCWHNEDHYTYSINYQHFGDTKTWYGVPGSDAYKLEDALRKAAPDLFEQSPDLLFQLVTMMSPDKLKKEGVRVYAADQRANEFVITYPKAYHSGFNHGFNLNEAVNFALPDWVDLDLECVRRYQQYNRFPVFSHDELIVTVYQHNQSVDAATWLQASMREMVERETSKRNEVRELVPGIQEVVEDVDLPEPEYQCAHCNVFCYLGQITSEKAKGVACLDHMSQVCGVDSPTKWTLRLRYSDEQLQSMLTKTIERAAIPSNWQARLHKVIISNARPSLRSLRGLLHEGEKIPYPVAEVDQLREFVEKANKWVDEATSFIARRHQKRAGVATKDLAPRRAKRGSRAYDEDESMAVANYDDMEQQLGEPEKVYTLLAEAELLPFDAPEIAALHGVVQHMEEFKHRASDLLARVKKGSEPKMTECEEVVSLGSTLSVRLDELDALQTYVNRRKWLAEIDGMRDNFFNLDEVQSYMADGHSLGVTNDDSRMTLLRERRDAGLAWKQKAEDIIAPTSRMHKRSCRWQLADVDEMTKASYKVAIVPELHIKLEHVQKQVKDLTKQCAGLLEPVQEGEASNPVTKRYIEAQRFLDQAGEVNVKVEGEDLLWQRVQDHERLEEFVADWIRSTAGTKELPPLDAQSKLDWLQVCKGRVLRATDPADDAGGRTTSKCICRQTAEMTAEEESSEVQCIECGETYHVGCLKIGQDDIRGRKKKSWTCHFCQPSKLVPLLAHYKRLPMLALLRQRFTSDKDMASPFGKPEACSILTDIQSRCFRFERMLNQSLDQSESPDRPLNFTKYVHLLKKSLAVDCCNLQVDRFASSAVTFLSQVLFAHKGLDRYGEPALQIPWRDVAPGDPRYAPHTPRTLTPELKEQPAEPTMPVHQPIPQPLARPMQPVNYPPRSFMQQQMTTQHAPMPMQPYGPWHGRFDDGHRPMLPHPMREMPSYSPIRPPPMAVAPGHYDFRAMSPDDRKPLGVGSSPQAFGSPDDGGKGSDDSKKRKRGKRARFVFQEEVGIFVPVNGERIYCLCRRGETGKMVSCDRCALWFHTTCVHVNSAADLGSERWICPMCCVKTERRYPFAEVKVKEMGVTDPNMWLDVRATLRSTRGPVSKLQHWTVDETKRIVLHLESFYPATLPSALDRDENKRQRSSEADGPSGHVRSGSHGSASSGPSTSNVNALGSVSRMPSWNDVQARVTPAHRTPSAEEHALRLQREADERHHQGMTNLYARGVTDAMIQKWYIGWNGKELVYPHYDQSGHYLELSLGTHIDLTRDDPDGSRLIRTLLDREAKVKHPVGRPAAVIPAQPVRSPKPGMPLLVPSKALKPGPPPTIVPAPKVASSVRPPPQAPLSMDFARREPTLATRASASPARPIMPLPTAKGPATHTHLSPHGEPLARPSPPGQMHEGSAPNTPAMSSRSLYSVPAIPPYRPPDSAGSNNDGGGGSVKKAIIHQSSTSADPAASDKGGQHKGNQSTTSASGPANNVPPPLPHIAGRTSGGDARPVASSLSRPPRSPPLARPGMLTPNGGSVGLPSLAGHLRPSNAMQSPSSPVAPLPMSSNHSLAGAQSHRSSPASSPYGYSRHLSQRDDGVSPRFSAHYSPVARPPHPNQASPRISAGSHQPLPRIAHRTSPPLSARHPLGLNSASSPAGQPMPLPSASVRAGGAASAIDNSHSDVRTLASPQASAAGRPLDIEASSYHRNPTSASPEKSPDDLRMLARRMRPSATDEEIDEMVRHAMQ